MGNVRTMLAVAALAALPMTASAGPDSGSAQAPETIKVPSSKSYNTVGQKGARRISGVAIMHPTEGSSVRGYVRFYPRGANVIVSGEIEGLTPGEHGFHIHEFGDCSAKDGSSAGGHFNPRGAPHAARDSGARHIGDLGNITADEKGYALIKMEDGQLKVDGEESIIGRGLIIHANADDFQTQPTGAAGGRVACGVIGIGQ